MSPLLLFVSREQFARPRQNLTTCQTISNLIEAGCTGKHFSVHFFSSLFKNKIEAKR
jgi:hypothetical protein